MKEEVDQQAITERLVEETWVQVEQFNRIAERYPEVVTLIARRQNVWPCFVSNKRGVVLISDKLPFGRLWYCEPNATSNAVD